MTETGTEKTGVDKDTTPITPVYTPEQQEHIQTLIDQRIGKVRGSYEKQLEDLNKKLEELSAKAAPAPKGKEGKDGKDGEGDDETKKQFKNLLEAEKANTQKALEMAKANEQKAKELELKNLSIQKSIAIKEAAADQENFSFHDLKLVQKLTEENIEWDEDHNAFVVKENGVIKQNNSLQPMTLKEYFTQFAAAHPFLVSSKVKGGAGSGEGSRSSGGVGKVTSKADLKTVKEKVEYINKFGQEAFEALPAK